MIETSSIYARCPQFTSAIWSRPAEGERVRLHSENVGQTEVAALFGASPNLTPLSLWAVKARRLDAAEGPSAPSVWHARLKNAVAAGICADRGWEIVGAHRLYVRSEHYVGMAASPDYVVNCPKRGFGLLCISDACSRRKQVSLETEIQLQHQIECAGLAWGAVGGLIGGNETQVYIRERDKEVGADIGNRVTDLWRRVRDNDPPGADYLKRAAGLVVPAGPDLMARIRRMMRRDARLAPKVRAA